MNTLVMKFGGKSLSTPKQFLKIANIVLDRKESFDNIVVVVSAMGKTTDQLIALAKKVHAEPPSRELDMLLSVGERVSMALLAMAFASKNIEAISFTGSQSGIITSSHHSNAKIIDVRPHRILKELSNGKIVIVAGFQGVSQNGEITTLGRGGSDTSAVALAAALHATKVEFYKDVEGVYSSDPKTDSSAKVFSYMHYDDLLALTGQGAKVLHHRSVFLAKKNLLPLQVLSFKKFRKDRIEKDGTRIGELVTTPIESPKYEEI